MKPTGVHLARCKGCGEEIFWAMFPGGSILPVSLRSTPRGRYVVLGVVHDPFPTEAGQLARVGCAIVAHAGSRDGRPHYAAHFTECENRDDVRQRDRAVA